MFILTSSYQYTIIGYHFNEWIQALGVARRCVECEMLTDGRRMTDDGRKVMTIAHMA
jgi:hypothetical protein